MAAASPLAEDDDVTASQRAHGPTRLAAARRGLVPRQVRLGVGNGLAQGGVLAEVTQTARHVLLQALQTAALATSLSGQLHDPAVGLELGEGLLEHLTHPHPRHALKQVDGHVVGRTESGDQRVGTPGGQRGDRGRLDVVSRQHDGVALHIDAAAPGPPRQLGVLPRAEGDVGRAVPLAQRLQDHGAGGHVDAQCQGLSGVDDLDQARAEELLHRLLEHRQQPRVVGRDAALQGVGPEVEAEDPQVAGGDVSGAPLDDLPDSGRLGLGSQVHPGADHLVDGLLTARPREDEDDRGQQARPLQGRDHLKSRRRLQPSRAGSPLATARCPSPSGGVLPGLRPSGRTATAATVAVLGSAAGGGGTPGLLDGLEQLGVERGLPRLLRLPLRLSLFGLVELV